jgi:hypothetical protein
MRVTRLVFSFSLSFFLSISLAAQQTASSNPQALQLLQRALSTLGGVQTLTDVTLSGTARRVVGSDDDTGTAALKAVASGASRVDLALSSGQRSEVLNTSVAPPAGAWSGPDGVSHAIAFHNLLTSPSWFFPAFIVAEGLSSSAYVATYIGPETHNGQAVQHVTLSRPPSPASNDAPLMQHLTEIDLYLDSSTFLPAAIDSNTHPDNNELLDIPVEIRFSNYQAVNGVHVPFHIQKYLNNNLFLDFQLQSATFNAGLTASTFSVQ